MRKWKSDTLRTTLGLAEAAAAAAAEAAGARRAKPLLPGLQQHSQPDYTVVLTRRTLNLTANHLMISSPLFLLLSLSNAPTRAQLPKHLRPEAEIWKPSGHWQVKLPSVLAQVPKVQISGSWEHSSMSGKNEETRRQPNHKPSAVHKQSIIPICTITTPPCRA